MKTICFLLASFVLVFLCKETSTLGLFQSLDFAREALMQFSRGKTRTVQVKSPIEKVVVPKKTTSRQNLFPLYRSRRRRFRPRPSHKDSRTTVYDIDDISTFSVSLSSVEVEKKPLSISAPLKPRITYKRKTKVYRPRSSPSNHFLTALNEIERALAEARVSGRRQPFSQAIVKKLKKYIKLGSRHRNYHFARRGIGQALHLLQNSGLKKKPKRGKRSPLNTATTFLEDLKTQMSPEKFDELLAVQGDVTLMFAIDTTGSMREEISNAKKIAIEVVNYNRSNPVDYLLSPFNDPEVGPTTFHEQGQDVEFVKAIQSLTAHGGDDCPEKTFQGILNALHESPRWGSPLYVFTDATAKDDTPSNIEQVDYLVYSDGITVNFFITDTCPTNDRDHFKELAEKSGGQVIRLSNAGELKRLSGLTGSVLGGSNTIGIGSNLSGRKKRSLSKNDHFILIDDSIEDVTFSITTEKPSSLFDVTLKDPRKVVITSGKVALSRIHVYQIKNPRVGTWKLTIPTRAGKCEFFVKGSSATNIDFELSFMIRRTRGRITEEIPIWHPVIGQSTQVLITVAGADKVRRGSLTLKFITKYGEFISSHRLQLRGKNNVHYISTFTTPSTPFRIQLDGTTTSGNPFKRISRNIVTPKGALLRVVHASNYFTLPTGRTTFVLFEIINGQQYRETFEIKARSKRGYMILLRRSRKVVRAGHRARFSISLRSTRSSDVGKTEFLTVSVTGKLSRAKSVQVVQLMVVDS